MSTIAKLRELDQAGKRGRLEVCTYHDVGAAVYEVGIKEHGRGELMFCGVKSGGGPDIEVASVFAAASNALPALLAIAEAADKYIGECPENNPCPCPILRKNHREKLIDALAKLEEVEL